MSKSGNEFLVYIKLIVLETFTVLLGTVDYCYHFVFGSVTKLFPVSFSNSSRKSIVTSRFLVVVLVRASSGKLTHKNVVASSNRSSPMFFFFYLYYMRSP